jgi:mRNA interferase YafQ
VRKLITTPKFNRSLRKFTKRNSELRERVQKTLEQMTEDVFAANLDTHKLSGSLDGINACSCGYDCRVLFSIDRDPETDSELIILLDVGNHDDVY